MQGLKAGNDAQLAEARNILRADGLDVLDAGARVAECDSFCCASW